MAAVIDQTADRLTIEREKGFEPSTSTLARGFRTNDPRWFAGLTVQSGAESKQVGFGGALGLIHFGRRRGSTWATATRRDRDPSRLGWIRVRMDPRRV